MVRAPWLPPTSVATPQPERAKPWAAHIGLTMLGLSLALVGLVWWWTSRPPEGLADTDYVVCRALEIERGIPEGITACAHAQGPVIGPAIMAGVGAFLVLLGVILYAGRRS